MRFCCVTPCLDAEKHIERTMLSVLGQAALENAEHSLHYVIQDGGSKDRTVEIIESIVKEYVDHPNIELAYQSEPDSGMYDALAKGFQYLPGGDIYSYINAGDIYENDGFQIVAQIFEEPGVHFLTGKNCWYNESGKMTHCFLPSGYNRNLVQKGFYGTILPFIQQESTFWDNTAHQLISYDELRECKYAGDFYLWTRFIEKMTLYIVDARLGGFNIHEGQLSAIYFSSYLAEMKSLSIKPLFIDYIHAYILRIWEYFPGAIKKMISDSIVECDSNAGESV